MNGTKGNTIHTTENTKVLILDDSNICRQVLRKCLEKHLYNVVELSDPTIALETTIIEQPIIILCDVQMPQMSGFEVCQTLKNNSNTQNIPILFMTSEGKTEQIVKGFEVGGSDYISKTADETEIIARVKTHINIANLQKQQEKDHEKLKTQVIKIQESIRKEQTLRNKIEEQQSKLLQSEKMASIGQLAAGVAHEINNPIGFISSNLNSLEDYIEDIHKNIEAYEKLIEICQDDPSKINQQLKTITALRNETDIEDTLTDLPDLIKESIEGTQRVRKIVADLRDFSHIDNPDASEEDINELMEKTINVASNELKYKANIVKEYGDLPALKCYGGKLGQVFLNLLVNGAQSIDTHGTITIRTGHANNNIWVEIEDTGRGIPKENLDRIYEPFFTTKEVGKGTGLGLNLSYKIIQAHNGNLTVNSQVGKGTTFRIELPLDAIDSKKIEGITNE